jgi:AcrR family transcriptional regulator
MGALDRRHDSPVDLSYLSLYSRVMRGRPQSISEQAILDAARDVFRDEGHAATTAKIARRAGVSEGILFYRYKSKEALLVAVLQRETEPPERLRELAKEAGRRSLAANLEILIEAMLDSAFRVQPFLDLAMTSPSSDAIREALFTRSGKPPPERIVELISAYLQAEMRLGRARKHEPAPVARAIFGGCLDFVHSRLYLKKKESEGERKSFVGGLVDLLLHGLADPSQKRAI